MADDEIPDTGEPLSDPKYEKFCQLVAAGQPVEDAYEMAGFRPHRSNCFRLRHRPKIERRIALLISLRVSRIIDTPPQAAVPIPEITKEAIERIELCKDYVVSRLIHNSEVALGLRLTKSTVRLPTRKTKVEPVDKAPTITFEHTDRNGSVANAALIALGKHIGMWNDKTPAGENDPTKEGAIVLGEKEKARDIFLRYFPEANGAEPPKPS